MKAKKEGWLRCTVTDGGHISVAETFKLGVHTWKGCKDKLNGIIRKYDYRGYRDIYYFDAAYDGWFSIDTVEDVIDEINKLKDRPLSIEIMMNEFDGSSADYVVRYTIWLADADTPYDKKKAAELVMVDYEED